MPIRRGYGGLENKTPQLIETPDAKFLKFNAEGAKERGGRGEMRFLL